MKRWGVWAGLACGALLAVATVSAETLEDVEKQVMELWGKNASMTATVHMKLDMQMPGNGGKAETEGNGTFEWMRSGDKVLYRMELKNKMIVHVKEQQMALEQETVSVSDGEKTTTLSSQMGRRTATRDKLDPTQPTSADGLFGAAREHYDFALASGVDTGGANVWVIETTPKKPMPRLPAKKVQYFVSKESGAIVRVIWLNEKGERFNDTQFTDVKLGATIDPKRFELEIPEGVQLVDRTSRAPAAPAKPTSQP